MSLPLKWELPGGKPEPGEELLTCLHRETWEELRLTIEIKEPMDAYDREFKGKYYRIQPYLCTWIGGEVTLMEHKAAVWQPVANLLDLDWGPAETVILKQWLAQRSSMTEVNCIPS